MIGAIRCTQQALFNGSARNLITYGRLLPATAQLSRLHKCFSGMQYPGMITVKSLSSTSMRSNALDVMSKLNRERKTRDLLAYWDQHVKVTPTSGLDAVQDSVLTVYLGALHRARDARFDGWHDMLIQQHTSRSYCLLLSVYCYRDLSSRIRMVLEAWNGTLEEAQKAGQSTEHLAFTLTGCQGVLGWLARRGMWRETCCLISAMEKQHATVEDFQGTMFQDISDSNPASGEVGQVMSYLRKLLTLSRLPAPDEACYRRALRACLHAGQLTTAVDLFESMKSRGLQPGPATVGTMLLLYKSKDVDPRHLLAFYAAITNQLESAEGVLFEKQHTNAVKSCGLTMDELQSDTFVGRCAVTLAQRGYIEQALALTERLGTESPIQPKIVYSSMLKTLIDMKLWSEAYEVFKRIRDSRIRLDATLHEQITRVLAENKRWHLLSEITKSQVPHDRFPTESGTS